MGNGGDRSWAAPALVLDKVRFPVAEADHQAYEHRRAGTEPVGDHLGVGPRRLTRPRLVPAKPARNF
jgi:hypothetical protein